jgi:hypothetical protein
VGPAAVVHHRLIFTKLTRAAEDRLKQLAQTGTRIVFACEKQDRKALDSHLKRSRVFNSKDFDVADSNDSDGAFKAIDSCSVVVVFTDTAQKADFLDRVVETALNKKKQGIHAKSTDKALIPSKAMAYRWPSLEWEKLEEMFRD